MKPHPHAEVLRAIADGVPLDEFETSKNEVYWDPIGHLKISDFFAYDRYIRRKPQHIMVNGFKVPKPIGLNCGQCEVWTPDLMSCGFASCWNVDGNISLALRLGIAHATKEAAIAHAKAMLGIDPEYFK